jgi:integrase
MARTVRDNSLETRAARDRLKPRHKPYYRLIDPGCHLGYYKGARGGSWTARYFLGSGKYAEKTLGLADDIQDSDGRSVLTFAEAQKKAREWFGIQARLATGEGHIGPYTVADAWRDYLIWFGAHRKSLNDMKTVAAAHILPALAKLEVTELTTANLRAWHTRLASTPPRVRSKKGAPVRYRELTDDPDSARRRKATANRPLTILKASLNHAWREGKAATDEAWRRVTPFHNVDAPRIRYLTQEQCTTLLAACEPTFRKLVQAALYSGCRYGELAALRVSDFDPASGSLRIRRSKSGHARNVYVNSEAAAFFEACRRFPASASETRLLASGRYTGNSALASERAIRPGDAYLVQRADGSPWNRSQQVRPLLDACEAAEIYPAISFHILRHTYASLLVMAGAPLQVVAQNMGHADTRMTERHYAHLASSYVAETIRKLSPRLGPMGEGRADGSLNEPSENEMVEAKDLPLNVVAFNAGRRTQRA